MTSRGLGRCRPGVPPAARRARAAPAPHAAPLPDRPRPPPPPESPHRSCRQYKLTLASSSTSVDAHCGRRDHGFATRFRFGGQETPQTGALADSNRNAVERQANLPPLPFGSAPGLTWFAATELMVREAIYRKPSYRKSANRASGSAEVAATVSTRRAVAASSWSGPGASPRASPPTAPGGRTG